MILLGAERGLSQQKANGCMPAGRNGPWDDPDTPVRNTSHWLITFLKAQEISGQERYRKAAKSALAYLLSSEARPEGVAWHHRDSSKSKTNGLVGQAWTIEALWYALESDLGESLESVLRNVIMAHPFNSHLAAWEYIELDGSSQRTMFTINQQIWFTAMVSRVANSLSDAELQHRVRTFLDHLEEKISLTDEGAIHHYQSVPAQPRAIVSYILANAKQRRIPKPILQLIRPENKEVVRERTIGYHSFCLTGLAVLAEENPDHAIWESEKIEKSIAFSMSDEYFSEVSDNRFGFQYNVPGFEIPYCMRVFSDIGVTDGSVVDTRKWIDEQFNRHWNRDSQSLSRNTVDPRTLSARLYEATRIVCSKSQM